MSTRRSALLTPALCVVTPAIAVPALSQSYGLGDQVLVIGATEFHPESNSARWRWIVDMLSPFSVP